MKKFILSLGVIAALTTAFVFTSCKDDKEPEQEVKVIYTDALNAVAKQTGGRVQGETVLVTNPDNTITTYSYTYTVGGQTYTSTAALQEALAGMTGTVNVTTTLYKTTGNGQPQVVHSQNSQITITDGATTSTLKFPTTTDQVVSGQVIVNGGNGGHGSTNVTK